MSRPERKLDYLYAPVPARALDALREGRLSRDDLAILAVLYWRADRRWKDLPDEAGRRYFPARASLDQLMEDLSWAPLTPRWLRERLHRLRDGGWLDFETTLRPVAAQREQMQKAEAEHAAQRRELVDDHVRRLLSLGTAAALDRVPTGPSP